MKSYSHSSNIYQAEKRIFLFGFFYTSRLFRFFSKIYLARQQSVGVLMSKMHSFVLVEHEIAVRIELSIHRFAIIKDDSSIVDFIIVLIIDSHNKF